MEKFQRSEAGDSVYSAIGRALTFATRFETSCFSLAFLMGSGKAFVAATESDRDQQFEALFERNWHVLARNIQLFETSIPAKSGRFLRTVVRAKEARNDLVHKLTSSLDRQGMTKVRQRSIMRRLERISLKLAAGDLVVCMLLYRQAGRDLLSDKAGMHLAPAYLEHVENWICSLNPKSVEI